MMQRYLTAWCLFASLVLSLRPAIAEENAVVAELLKPGAIVWPQKSDGGGWKFIFVGNRPVQPSSSFQRIIAVKSEYVVLRGTAKESTSFGEVFVERTVRISSITEFVRLLDKEP